MQASFWSERTRVFPRHEMPDLPGVSSKKTFLRAELPISSGA